MNNLTSFLRIFRAIPEPIPWLPNFMYRKFCWGHRITKTLTSDGSSTFKILSSVENSCTELGDSIIFRRFSHYFPQGNSCLHFRILHFYSYFTFHNWHFVTRETDCLWRIWTKYQLLFWKASPAIALKNQSVFRLLKKALYSVCTCILHRTTEIRSSSNFHTNFPQFFHPFANTFSHKVKIRTS